MPERFLGRTLRVLAIGELALTIGACGAPDRPVSSFQPRAERQTAQANPQTIRGVAEQVKTPTPDNPRGTLNLDGLTEMDRTSSGHVRFMQSTEFGGTINAVIAQTNVSDVYIDLLTANNQTPTTTGDDTAWSDDQAHMQSLSDMIANNPERHGLPFLYGQTGDYWGDVHTSPEGTVVHEGQILRINPNRAAYCLDGSGRPYIGKFTEQQLREMGCVTAFGAGPIVLKDGKVANPQYNGESNMIPWNPEDEGFANMDYRIQLYMNDTPQTMIGYGYDEQGNPYTVMLTSYGTKGINAALMLQKLGCTGAMLLDGDSQTEFDWRGNNPQSHQADDLSTAAAIFAAR